MLRLHKLRLISGAFRSFNTSYQDAASHYDVLGIPPKATQNDIKTAYYNLSKLYHPDLSNDEESAIKFRAIAEAYEVLGNISMKKMYDKGLLPSPDKNTRVDYHPDPDPIDPSLRFYRSRINRHVIPTMDGRIPIYNFDAWSKNHYGDLLQKSQNAKDFVNKKNQNEREVIESNRQEVLLYMMVGLGGLFFFFVVNGTTDYDKIDKNKQTTTDYDKIEKNKQVTQVTVTQVTEAQVTETQVTETQGTEAKETEAN